MKCYLKFVAAACGFVLTLAQMGCASTDTDVGYDQTEKPTQTDDSHGWTTAIKASPQ